MKKSDLKQLIKEEIQNILKEGKDIYVGKWKTPKGTLISKFRDDEGNVYLKDKVTNYLPVDLEDGEGNIRPTEDILRDIRNAREQMSYNDYRSKMRGY